MGKKKNKEKFYFEKKNTIKRGEEDVQERETPGRIKEEAEADGRKGRRERVFFFFFLTKRKEEHPGEGEFRDQGRTEEGDQQAAEEFGTETNNPFV